MKLAEALIIRADLQKKLASLRDRIGTNCKVQEGESPSENPEDLLKDAFGVLQEFESIVVRINHANLSVKMDDGRTLTEAIARRDLLAKQHALLTHLIQSAKQSPEYYSAREVRWKTIVNVAGLQKQSDDIAMNLRDLNTRIQEINWKSELAD